MIMITAHSGRRWVRSAALVSASCLAVGAAFIGAGPAQASSHREAPLIAGDPKADNTDVYAFVSPDKSDTVTLLANWIPFEEPNGGPNFYPFEDGAHYDINIDNNGDAKADLTYRWTFTTVDSRGTDTFLYNNGPVTSLDDANLLFKQTYTLTLLENGADTGATIATGTVAPSFTGRSSMPVYSTLRDESVADVTGGGQTFAGQSDDPFFLDLRVFDLLYGGNLKRVGQDTLKGYNVNTVGLQIPKTALALNGDADYNPVIGIWSSTSKQTMTLSAGKADPTGPFVQVSRLGNPLVNEVVVPSGLKDAFNSITPDVDHTVTPVVNRVTDPELPKLIQAIYGVPAPATPRNDLVEIYLTGIAKSAPTLDGTTAPIQADLNSQVLNRDVDASTFVPSEMLRLNMAVPVTKKPSRLGVLGKDFQGFPNGRRLTDDVIDISLQAVEGAAQSGQLVAALKHGDKVNTNDRKFTKTFPYIALPNANAVNRSMALPMGPLPSSGDDGSRLPGGGLLSGALRIPGIVLASLLIGAGGIIGLRMRRPGSATAGAIA
jgi:Domain of unknown function (DUF4331)